jgi:hypothetical protein
MPCVPTLSVEVVNVAIPDPFNTNVPSIVDPSVNLTVPVGVRPAEFTVTVNVTDWLSVEGFNDEVTAVLVVVDTTPWLNTGEVLALKLLSPL